ncbi:hypothetical protein N6H18_09835 [Reichenbachiella agarivorans]|uniref:DUF1735 domain-containing protein n=1 Tax=Reichenbachiella agarivorans TaxID=2979464 RepID=A0ABY6CJF2_9BACT|nr:hypothetical protein [Reichenbachiella agarivorans]UXP30654.1 hypothetical protein N6H18_09835 [Reichenbachiella agarivorans]
MKNSILSLTIFSILLIACDKLDKLTQFNMKYTESVTIQSSTIIGIPISLNTPSIESNSESTFAGNNTKKELIEEIRLDQMDLTVTSPADGTFSFLESATLYISADGLDEIEIAYLEEVPEDAGSSISLDVTGVDLKEYLLQDSFQLRMKSSTDETIASDHQIEIYSVFFVDAKILGQ